MADEVEHEEKTFHHYFDLSSKMRNRIINKMQTSDRCRSTRCSKSCSKEAKASKNYIYGLSFFANSENHLIITTNYGKHDPNRQPGFHIFYTMICGTKYAIYKNADYQELWRIELDKSTNLFNTALQNFKSAMQFYQTNVKMLSFITDIFPHPPRLRCEDLGIENLESLEDLTLQAKTDYNKAFSKIRHPLKKLSFFGIRNIVELHDYEKIYQVQEELTWWNGKFDYKKLMQLSAKTASIDFVSERDVFKFIRSWQNGTIRRVIHDYKWKLFGSVFNKVKFARLLRTTVDALENEQIEIKHFKEPGISAILSIHALTLYFRTIRHE